MSSYTAALAEKPDNPQALSNRAAAHIALNSHHLAIQDTNKVSSILFIPKCKLIHIYLGDKLYSQFEINFNQRIFIKILFCTQQALSLLASAKEPNIQSKLLCLSRRSASYAALGDVALALADVEAALALQPEDSTLQDDFSKLRKALETTTSEGGSSSSCWFESGEEDKSCS